MSKHLGNILEPIPLMDRHGADAVRWFMLAGGSPWSARRVGHKVLDEIASKVLRTYWSIASFQSLYARANGWTPAPATAGRPSSAVLDRWALSGAHALVDEVSDGARRLRHRARRQGARRLHRRPVELVRAPVAAAVLGRRPGRAGDAARVPRHPDPAAGAVRAVRAPSRSGRRCSPRPAAARLGAPGALAGGRPGAGRRRARRAGRAGPPPGRTRPGGAGRVRR